MKEFILCALIGMTSCNYPVSERFVVTKIESGKADNKLFRVYADGVSVSQISFYTNQNYAIGDTLILGK